MTVSLRLVLICLVAFGRPILSYADDALRWKFQPGDEQNYRMSQTMDMELTLSAANRTIKTSTKQVVDWHWKVENVDDQGNATIVLTVERLQSDMKAPGLQEMHFDTASEKSPTGFAAMLAPLSKTLASASITITLTPRGTIKKSDLPQALIDFEQSLPGKKRGLPVGSMTDALRNEESFTKSLQHALFELPEKQDLTAAENWTLKSAQDVSPVGTITSVTTYRYTGTNEVDDKAYETFSAQSKLDFEDTAENLQINVIDHQSKGEVLFDRAAGRLQSNKLQQQTELRITSDGQETLVRMMKHSDFEFVTGQNEKQP